MDGSVKIHRAFLKAADRIEQHPDHYNFGVSSPPMTVRDQGCALGWLAYYLYPRAERHGLCLNEIAERLECEPDSVSPITIDLSCGVEGCQICSPFTIVWSPHESTFYNRMDKLNRARNWRKKPERCAQTLRKYADKYHKVAA